MARKTRGRRRKSTRRRRNPQTKASRRRAALKGWRRKKRGGRKRRRNPRRTMARRRPRRTTTRRKRRRNARGWFRTRGPKRTYGRRGKTRRFYGKKRYTRPRRRRNPNGFIGTLMKTDTWMNAGQIAIGAIGSGALAGWAYNQFAPAALKTENAQMIARPLSIALAGAVGGWALHTAGMKKFAKQFAWGGIVAAAIDIAGQIGKRMGLLGMGDYVQLDGLGTQAQVEAGVFGMGTQAQVEAGVFGTGDYIQLDGLGHSEEAVAMSNTFGPTF